MRDALAAVDAVLRQGRDHDALLAHLLPRVPGNTQARAVIGLGDGRSESAGESRCRATMHLAGVPMPDLQVEVVDRAGVVVARCDFGWASRGVMGEFDGLTKYGRLLRPGQSVNEVIAAEKTRERRILTAGFWPIRWTSGDLKNVVAFRRGILDAFDAARSRRARA